MNQQKLRHPVVDVGFELEYISITSVNTVLHMILQDSAVIIVLPLTEINKFSGQT